MFGFLNKRPTALDLQVYSHPSIVAALHVIGNDFRFVDFSLRGRSQVSGFNYQSMFGAKVAFDVMWYDVEAEQFYATSFDINANDLSTFGEEGIHASMRITVGPGADVTITTPQPELLRLLGLNLMDDITPEMDVPVTLLELCAERHESDPSPSKALSGVSQTGTDVLYFKQRRDDWLSNNAAPQPRCPAVPGDK